jgi:membrane protein DedA with SNARE-associated domain
MSLALLISTYGYAAIAAGTFFEGETVLILAGLAIHQGYLSLPGVLACAFLATLAADQFYFSLGRAKGIALLDKRPSWKSKSEWVFARLRYHQTLVSLSFRFFYGVRVVVPFTLGATGIPRLRFLVLDMLGAGTWAVLYVTLGYFFGRTLDIVLGNIKRYEAGFFAIVAIVGILVWIVHRWPRKNRPAPPQIPP